MSKFTNIEASILKKLYKEFTTEDLNKIVVYTITSLDSPYWEPAKKYLRILKLYGAISEPEGEYGGHSTAKLTDLTKYAKWVLDNTPDDWPEDKLFDFKTVENPIKAEMSRYVVDANESGSQSIYKSGSAEILAWDEDDAHEKGENDFWEWDGEMEDSDYGDWYSDGVEIDTVNLVEQMMLERKYGIIQHQIVRPGDIINESTSKMNPELKVDDIVRVIDIDGEHGRMPERFGIYRVVKVGKTFPLMAMRNRGHANEYYDIEPYPNSSTQFSELDTKTIYRGDTWIYGNTPTANKVDNKTIDSPMDAKKTISEHKESKFNPELELGDVIRVISVDREVEDDTIKYNIPSPELKPKLYTQYAVVEKNPIGHKSKWPWKYALILADRYQDYLNGSYMITRDTVKLLYPWLYQWMHDKKPETINEHKEKFNPQLIVGDEVTVINLGMERFTNDEKPELYKHYVVTAIKPTRSMSPRERYDYVIEPIEQIIGGEFKRVKYSPVMLYGVDTWMLRKGFIRGVTVSDVGELGEQEEGHQPMSKDEVQSIVDKVYPHIIDTLGGSDYFDIPPTVELWEDIYARVSGIEGMEGEHSASSKAQFDDTVNTIFIYYPNMKDEKHVVQSLLHEYTHSLQDPNKKEENRKDGYELDPDEMAALKAESTWEYYMGYIKYDLNEHKQSKFNQQLMVGDEVTVVNVDKTYGTMNTPKHLKDYVVTGIKYRQPGNWRLGPDVDKKYYIIEPLGMTDDERLGGMLAGGGRRKEEHLYPTDTWMLKKGFLRGELGEHGADTSWANDDDKVTLKDILELTKDIPTISYPTKELAKLPSLKKIVLGWDTEEIERISQVDVSRQYPILVMVNEYNEVQWILDGNHRAQQAVMNDIPTIPAKLIKPSDLDERSIKMFYPEGIPGGELGEEGETNEASRTLSKARKAGVDTYYPKSAVKSNPQRFRKYTRDKYLKEDLKNWSYDGDNIGVEEELDEYCPMGNPNKCKLVDYNNLPDMITDEVVEEQFDNEITVADAIKKDIMKVLSMRFVLQPTEESNIKDSEGQSYNIIDTENPLEVVEIEMLIQPIIDMVNSGVAGGELTPQDTNLAISGVTDWLSLAMNQKVELPN